MCPIKFRAWDEKEKKMLPWDSAAMGCMLTKLGETEREGERELEEWGDCIFMQFTGLRDKKGKEIYEGDILDEGCGEQHDFYFLEWPMRMIGIGSRRQHDLDALSARVSVKVVGNIYENPDLLK